MLPLRCPPLVLALALSFVCACAASNGQDESLADDSPPVAALGLPLPVPVPLPGSPAPAPAAGAGCSFLNNYTAAIAEATIACTGTLGPDSLAVGASGLLQRNFGQCSASVSPASSTQLMQTVDDLLSLQQRADVANAKTCFPQQWSSWRASFLQSGNAVCPTWSKVASIGTATVASVAQVVLGLPVLNGLPTGGILQDVLNAAKENFLYLVSLPPSAPAQACGDALSCAAACTGGLPGFYVGQQNQMVVGDPCWWLSSATYASGSDPFMQNDYYHPMSYYGDPPGDIYGHRNRVSEACSRWGGDYHYRGILRLDCVSPNDPNSPCSSICDVQ
jgi:hypothetical protein